VTQLTNITPLLTPVSEVLVIREEWGSRGIGTSAYRSRTLQDRRTGIPIL